MAGDWVPVRLTDIDPAVLRRAACALIRDEPRPEALQDILAAALDPSATVYQVPRAVAERTLPLVCRPGTPVP